MENQEKPKKRYLHPDRVTLSPASLSKIAGWISQMTDQMKGGALSKSNLVEFLIESHGEPLTNAERKQIKDKFFDEVKFHEWAIDEYKTQKQSGLQLSFSEFLSQIQSKQNMLGQTTKPKQEKRTKQKRPDTQLDELVANDSTVEEIP